MSSVIEEEALSSKRKHWSSDDIAVRQGDIQISPRFPNLRSSLPGTTGVAVQCDRLGVVQHLRTPRSR